MIVTADWMSNTHGILLRRAQYVALSLFTEEAGGLEFSPTQYSVLAFTYIEPGIHQNVLGERIALDRSSVTKCVDVLESRNLIRRDVDSKDRRARLLFITDEGERMLEAVHAAAIKARHRIERSMGKDRFSTFLKDLQAFSSILNDAD